MNILVIGNGFDLAHGLPTRYNDFLFFCSVVKKIIEDNEVEKKIPKDTKSYKKWIDNNENIIFKKIDNRIFLINFNSINRKQSEKDKEVFRNMLDNFFKKIFFEKTIDQKIMKEILYLVFNNFWIDYFLQCDMHGDENWIDFESEISNVIQSLDESMRSFALESMIQPTSNSFLNNRYSKLKGQFTYKIVRNKLLNDLNKLIRVFEIYLCEYVEKIKIQKRAPNIEVLEINYVFSFNYTKTFSKLYKITKRRGENEIDSFDYIHGQVNINNTIETNNMVLGIDEYLPDDRKNKDIEFVAFKKFYQRIYKEIGCKYKEWIDEIREDWRREKDLGKNELKKQISRGHSKHNLYIFGHSLDVTDKDILRDLILNDNVYTTIFYLNKDVMGQQIVNLVKVIGQDELIKRTGGSTKTIEFKQQQEMIPINESKDI